MEKTAVSQSHCVQCGELLTYDFYDERDEVTHFQGDVDACCGNYDGAVRLIDATCKACCEPHYPGKPASGYYL